MRLGRAVSGIFAVWHISAAFASLTREKSLRRKPFTLRAFVSCSIWINTPSSMPCGCGLISFGSCGSTSVARSKRSSFLSGAT